ncbi:MAG: DUF1801 domain-containing protein [Chitinophagaceae bacterium]
MAIKNKTTETDVSVLEYLEKIADEQMRKDCLVITEIFQKASGFIAKMWGPSIVGFGSYHYKYDSGREGDAPLVCFSARAAGISLYLSSEFDDREALLSQFGKYKAGKACVTLRKLDDVNQQILLRMVENSVDYYQKKYC